MRSLSADGLTPERSTRAVSGANRLARWIWIWPRSLWRRWSISIQGQAEASASRARTAAMMVRRSISRRSSPTWQAARSWRIVSVAGGGVGVGIGSDLLLTPSAGDAGGAASGHGVAGGERGDLPAGGAGQFDPRGA